MEKCTCVREVSSQNSWRAQHGGEQGKERDGGKSLALEAQARLYKV